MPDTASTSANETPDRDDRASIELRPAFPFGTLAIVFLISMACWYVEPHVHDFDPSGYVTGSPVQVALLATVAWILAVPPASMGRNFLLAAFVVVWSFLSCEGLQAFPSAVIGYGTFVLAYSLNAWWLRHHGWSSRLELQSNASTDHQFSILQVLISTGYVAILLALARFTSMGLEFMPFLWTTFVIALSAVLLQRTLIATKGNRLWGIVTGAVVLGSALIKLIVLFSLGAFESERFFGPFVGYPRSVVELFIRYLAGDLFLPLLSLNFVSIFAARVGWLQVQNRCRAISQKALLEATSKRSTQTTDAKQS